MTRSPAVFLMGSTDWMVRPFSWVTAFICLVATPSRKVRATAGSFSFRASRPTTVFL